MCKAMEDLMQDVIEKRVQEATLETAQKSRLESIAAMMKKLNLTENQAMDVLDIPDSERGLYVVWLSKM